MSEMNHKSLEKVWTVIFVSAMLIGIYFYIISYSNNLTDKQAGLYSSFIGILGFMLILIRKIGIVIINKINKK